MQRRILSVATIGLVSLATLVAAGCSSAKGPYGLSGSPADGEQQARAQYTDSRGVYHPEWRAGVNTPAGYPRQVASAK
jgi:hypothetical protein